MKDNHKCPYCGRKVKYFTGLLEHSAGEHICPHCKKHSNISQKKEMWILLICAVAVALSILLFYLISGDTFVDAQKADGSYFALNLIFFGSGKMIKWIIWELVPFAAFMLISPCFMEYTPQKRFLEQVNTKNIDLSVPKMSLDKGSADTKRGSTKKIPLPSQTVFTGKFEDISSTSKDKTATRAFELSSDSHTATMNVNTAPSSTTQSSRSDAPLKRITHEPRREDHSGARATEPSSPVIPRVGSDSERPTPQKKQPGNFSANRKF